MTKKEEIYKCNICGNIVEVLHAGAGQLVCCGQSMGLLEEKNKDIGLEKHVPLIEKTELGIKVKVGATPHPMEEKHYIEWIELVIDNRVCRKFLNPGDKPEAVFDACFGQSYEGKESASKVKARAYCNIHGLWKS